MGRIADEDVRRVRDATDLVSLVQERVILKQKGRLFWGCCPFHQEKTPSFKIDPATQLWHCFGCGLGGDAYGWVMRTESVDFGEAVRSLADRAHIEIVETAGGVPRSQRERLTAATEAAGAFYHDMLTKSRDAGAAKARDYLNKRGFGSEVARRWQLGYAPGRGVLVRHLQEAGFSFEEIVLVNLGLKGDSGQLRDRFYERIMFPITDLQGRHIAFGGRVVGTGEPKYLNTAETPIFSKSKNLFGIAQAKGSITASGVAIVVEGYTDVIGLHQAAITQAIATLGTALTPDHVRLIGRFSSRIVYVFDGDAAGQRAAERAVQIMSRDNIAVIGQAKTALEAVVIPEGLDPADFVAAHGRDEFMNLVETARPLVKFAIDRILGRRPLDTPEGKAAASREVAEFLSSLGNGILVHEYTVYAADLIGTGFENLRREVSHASPTLTIADGEYSPSEDMNLGWASPADSPQLRTERDLLDLLVRKERLRPRARFLLSENLLTDPLHRAIAEGIVSGGEELSADALVGMLERDVPGAAEALSGATLGDVSDADLDAAERDMTRKLKEFDLERRIAVGKARLREPGSFEEPAEYDEVFRSVSALQRELEDYRQGVRDVG